MKTALYRWTIGWAYLAVLPTALAAAEAPQTPLEQQKLFHLPPGFEIQLVVSEPDIGPPMNLNFDAAGRLWITSSVEYPYPTDSEGVQPRPAKFPGVGDHSPRDWITVVEGIDLQGKPEAVRRFFTGLNISIGLAPLGDGSEAIVFSIPSIDRFTDTDADRVADRRTRLYGTIGNIDTHGMANSFTPWIDGWIYGCHGFSNTSEIRDGEGNVTRFTSGNTYRFRPDGSRFEPYTSGQVNPFGMTFDPLGNLYNADCHTTPVTMLLRGANYPHFGSQPDGLGFGPEMIDHNHGSTGICGPAYYAAEHFPAEFRDNIFLCNPVSQVVHRDRLKQFGSTYQVETLPDFVTCDDTWFRPVDAQVGPDGALYIADFYNPIIGHYEDPLDHPDRDRTHGRVWRIIYTGNDRSARPIEDLPDLTRLGLDQLLLKLDSPNLVVRTLATNWLVESAIEGTLPAVRTLLKQGSAWQRAHALWIVERLEGLSESDIRTLMNDPHRLPRVHTVRAIAERDRWEEVERLAGLRGLTDADPFVRRAAADALARHPALVNVAPLVELWNQTDPADTHLVHTIRLALREHFRDAAVGSQIAKYEWSGAVKRPLQTIAAASESPAAAQWLITAAQDEEINWSTLKRAARQIGKVGEANQVRRVQELTLSKTDDLWRHLEVLQVMIRAQEEAGFNAADQPILKQWGEQIVAQLGPSLAAGPAWTFQPLDSQKPVDNPWGGRIRSTSDGQNLLFLDSIVHGEQKTGILRSRPFPLPARLLFWMCGHNGFPGKEHQPRNRVQLHLHETDEVLFTETPPGSDTAQEYHFDLDEYAGQLGYLKLIDGHDGAAYAWLAVARFNPQVPPLPVNQGETSDEQLLKVINTLTLDSAQPFLLDALQQEHAAPQWRLAVATTLRQLDQQFDVLPTVAPLAGDGSVPHAVRMQAIKLLGSVDTAPARAVLAEALKTTGAHLQQEAALNLARSRAGLDTLLQAIEKGWGTPRLLQSPELQQRLASLSLDEETHQRIEQLTEHLTPVEEEVQQEIFRRVIGFSQANASEAAGAKVFQKHCAACHQVGGQGSIVGPQLDGIGNRGVARLVEDILDPSRNIDAAFRTVLIQTIDGQVISAMPRREEGQVLILADQEGKEIRLTRDEIDLQKDSSLSLMPANFGETLSQTEFFDLLAYLLAQQAGTAADHE